MQRSTLPPAIPEGSLAAIAPRQAGFIVKALTWGIVGLSALLVTAAWLMKPNRLSLDELEAIYTTPASEFADLDGVRTHYIDSGSGPVIVILHASFMNLRSWDDVADSLSEKYRVIRLDLLTAGLTGPEPNDQYSFDRNVELLDQLTQKLGIEKFSIVGTSSGGIVAFNYASRFPDKVRRLILINSAGMPRNAKTDPNRKRGSWLDNWLAKNYPSRARMRDVLDINFIEPHEPPDWLVDMNFDMSMRQGLEREGALLMANFKTGDPEQVLSGIKAPTMVGWGLDNQTVFHLEADVFARWLTNAPSLVKKYQGLGHYLYIEDPALIASDIDSFLSGNMDSQLRRQHMASAETQAAAASPGELRYSVIAGANNLPLQIVESGPRSAPGILFVHGWSLSGSSWKQQLESSLADDFHLVALDLRGHGNSAKPWDEASYADSKTWADDIAAVISGTGLQKPVIVAWSMGGHVTMDYLRHYRADSLSGLIFVGSTGGMQPFPPIDEETAQEFARMGALSMSGNAADRLQAARAFVDGMTQQPLTTAIHDREVAATLAFPPYARAAMLKRQLDNSDITDKVTLPVMFLMGDAERTATPEQVTKLVELLPQAQLKVYEQTGHMPFIERQERFDADLKAFALAVKENNE